MTAGRARALEGLRVVDASEGVAGPFATRLLGDMGAEVIKLEPPEGDRTRRRAPVEGAGGSLFEYLNWGKRGATADLGTGDGRARFAELAAGADVLVESFAPGHLAGLGLQPDRLLERNPGLVVTSVTPFGSTGPRAAWKSDDIVDWAAGGYMYFGGDPARAPLMIPGHQAEYHAAQAVAIATLAAVRHRRASGCGQWIDQSVQEATLATHAWLTVSWSHGGQVMRRAGPDMFQCRDGWVMWLKRMQEPTIFVLIERPDLLDDPRLGDLEVWRDPDSPIWQAVRAWCATQDKMDVYHRAQELRIPVTPVNTVEDLLASPQLEERDWFVTVPGGSDARHAGFPFKLSDTPLDVTGPAPALEVPSDAAPSAWPPREAGPRATAVQPATAGPLEGLQVIEVTANWAGPLAGRHFGDMGAEVIKVEHAKRPATRALWYAGNDPAKYAYNRAGYFNNLNRNKYDVSIDLATDEGRDLFLRLVDDADVVIENNSARVMTNLGIGWETLSVRNPRLVMVSISGFGATGPERNYVAYGANIEASSGLASLMGYREDEQPYRAGTFYADPIAANYAVVAVLGALEAREATGRGQWIDMSLNEAAATFFGGAFVDYQREGALPRHIENRDAVLAPQGCYRTIGDDAWVALTVRDEAEWHALCAVIGAEAWAADEGLATPEARQQRHDEIDGAIAAWCATQDHHEAARKLQAAGVPASPVLANWEVLSDAHLYRREFYRYIEHPEVGVYPYSGPPWKFSRTPATIRLPAPCFAEHNDYVLGTVLDLSENEIRRLEESGICSREPEMPRLNR